MKIAPFIQLVKGGACELSANLGHPLLLVTPPDVIFGISPNLRVVVAPTLKIFFFVLLYEPKREPVELVMGVHKRRV